MFYMGDYADYTKHLGDTTATVICDVDCIRLTFEALARKSTMQASGTVEYFDGTPNIQIETVVSANGSTNIDGVLGPIVRNNWNNIKSCDLKLKFKYKRAGESIRRSEANNAQIWYNGCTQHMYLNEQAARLLYIPDVLPAVCMDLEEVYEVTRIFEITFPRSVQSSEEYVKRCKEAFNRGPIVSKGSIGLSKAWPDEKQMDLMPMFNEYKYNDALGLATTLSDGLCVLSGREIVSNARQGNVLQLCEVYTTNENGYVRMNWDGSNVQFAPLLMDDNPYIEQNSAVRPAGKMNIFAD